MEDMTVMIELAICFAIPLVPLTFRYIADGIALKECEKEEHLIDRIEEIEDKYGVEITDDKLKMPERR